MSDAPNAGIYLLIEFDWPEPFSQEDAHRAAALHRAVQNQPWIREAVAASNGFGSGPRSVWVFWLDGYASLERLARTPSDPVCAAYTAFFDAMPRVEQKVREETVFL